MGNSNSLHLEMAARSCGGCCTRLLNVGVVLGGVPVLQNINLHVHCGELTVLIGPNGAGKTTLFRAMLGEIPYSGRLQFVHSESKNRFKKPRIGYVPQKLELDARSPITVLDLFAGARSRRPLWLGYNPSIRDESNAALAVVESQSLIDQRLGRLSSGQLQRVLLALALTPAPDLLLLDEPISGVDLAGIEMFYRLVSQLRLRLDLSIFLVSHDLVAAARVADRMIFLNRTVVCDGSPQKVLSDPEVKRRFGFDLDLVGDALNRRGVGKSLHHEMGK
ncbi:MAG: metal ABC transporter ATP-binding protein [Verrucomicrobia bacterium]|nr:metal ABC transporter ATP-binding protein [Verrucomicrobiota bacterium]MBU4247912.1 metal ABC transporter ATP-binding protein [Verrucomicrobiota bacterium]MBU4291878.1 metal ABC transporter ATP-binding protein [Verrucomicrobiota bacterium]MBU4498353.1 metal ABC transporter ATP-binding protein [Verrucomicrobiota bacterium]MCG2679176.1 metal ABC transporter ATP-binding protein [Kiritimatiellia bacterium]